MSSSGTVGFQLFAANLLRVRNLEAELAQEHALRREGFRASLTDQQNNEKANLGPLFLQSRTPSK
ncbi:MAG: hypothetical protein WBP38_06670 [Hyphomicrobium sp.]|nr:hypothetical protein [Hyphomicrobium sp.]